MTRRMRTDKKLAMLVVLAVLLGLLSGAALAQELMTDSRAITGGELPGSGELAAGYIERKLHDGPTAYSTSYGESALPDERNIAIYRLLKARIEEVAAAGGATTVELPQDVLGEIWISVEGASDPNKAMWEGLYEQINLPLIQECLLIDCAYELYWFDKTTGGMRTSASYYDYTTERLIANLSVSFAVVSAYRASGYNASAPQVTGDVSAVNAATQNARSVVAGHAGKSDMGKLEAYRDYLCDSIAYNHEAADAGYTGGYGDPWQIVWALDGDSGTNVVCEGYAKAFRYLCELSAFDDEDFACYLMSGDLGQNGEVLGPHMWNVVRLNDCNHLVDITSVDGDNGSVYNEAFMIGEPVSGDENGYEIAFGSGSLSFDYDPETLRTYDADKRRLGPVAGAEAPAVVWTLPSHLTEIGEEAFAGDTQVTDVIIPDGTTAIGARAFADCSRIRRVVIPASVTAIGEDAFAGCQRAVIQTPAGSYAQQYAQANGIACEVTNESY